MRSKWIMIILLSLILLLSFFVDLLIGAVSLPLESVLNYLFGAELEATNQLILHHSRMPKAITALLCGSALSVAGLQMQTLFRNPLAGPYILGISSGAGLGVAALLMGSSVLGLAWINDWSIAMSAFIGAFAILFILFLLSFRIRDVMTLLILGIMIGAVATALIGILQFYSTDFQLKSFVIWSLGSLDSLSYSKLGIMALAVLFASLLSFLISKPMNALLMGEDFAVSVGINLSLVRMLMILSTGVLAGTVTAYCGPIGFIGIIVPHLSRLLFNTSNHFWLIPASMLMGSVILLLSDVLSNLLGGELALPINSITALIGIPIVIWILIGKKRISTSF